LFGHRVRMRRIRLGLSQEKLADRAGVDVKTISNIQASRTTPRPSTVRLLAKALELSDGELASADGTGTPSASGRPGRVPAQLPADVPAFVG
jgi:transcriptional regulator with XRE-family HTH domain